MLDPTSHPVHQWIDKQDPAHGSTRRATSATQPHNHDANSVDLARPAVRATPTQPPDRCIHADPAGHTRATLGGPDKAWLTLAAVADELDVSTRTVMRWVERGQFPALILPGGRKRIHRDAFDAWLATLPVARGGR